MKAEIYNLPSPEDILASVRERQNKVCLKEARALKAEAEEKISQVISDYEHRTGCLVCDIGFWHNEFTDGVQKVEMRVELR